MKRNVWLFSAILLLCLAILPVKAEAIGGGLVINNFQVDDNGVITGYVGGISNMPERLVIPSDPRITAIGDKAFDGYSASGSNRTTKEVVIPANIESIGYLAFNWCLGIEKVTFESGSRLSSIGDGAFNQCSALPSISLPDSVTKIGSSCFQDCSKLASVKLSANLSVIPDKAFFGCPKLGEVRIPASVTEIGNYAFSHGDNRDWVPQGPTSVTFERGSQLKKIGYYAFANCTGLTSIELPDTVEELGRNCFSYCKSMTRAKLSKNLKGESSKDMVQEYWYTLPAEVFAYCSKLTTVDLNGATVENIGSRAFLYCESLTTVTGLTTSPGVLVVPEGVSIVGEHAFSRCHGLTSASLPSTLMRIYMGSNIFSGCENLRTAVINEMAGTSLPSGIFYNCKKLDSVTLPGNLTSIGSGAFGGCDALKEVRFGGSQEQWYAIKASEGNDILETLTYAGKVIYSAPPVTGEWEGASGLGWQYRSETGRFSYTKSSNYGSENIYVAAYDSKNRMLSIGQLSSPDDWVSLPSGAATVKMFLLDVCGDPNAVPCVIKAADLK